VPFSLARKTTFGPSPVASSSEDTCSALRQSFREISGSAASSASAMVEEFADDRGQDPRAGALVDADAEAIGLERLHVGMSRGQVGEDRLGVLEEHAAGVRGPHTLAANPALHEALADDALEARDLPADRRLRVAELPRSTVEGRVLEDGLERREVPQLDAEPPVS
jgi:hypothetical protein